MPSVQQILIQVRFEFTGSVTNPPASASRIGKDIIRCHQRCHLAGANLRASKGHVPVQVSKRHSKMSRGANQCCWSEISSLVSSVTSHGLIADIQEAIEQGQESGLTSKSAWPQGPIGLMSPYKRPQWGEQFQTSSTSCEAGLNVCAHAHLLTCMHAQFVRTSDRT